MASTSTNKQPLLIDRPLHAVTSIIGQKTGNEGYWLSNNSCSVLVDCTQNDGALIEDLYVLSRDAAPVNISFFLANATDVLRESDTLNVVFIGRIDVLADQEGKITHFDEVPYCLAPMPHVSVGSTDTRSSGQTKALYIPRGSALWVGRAVESTAANLDVTSAPIAGAQGGYY